MEISRYAMYKVQRFFCAFCGVDRHFRRHVPNHSLHLLFTVITFGLWGVSWLALIIHCARLPWTCRTCRRQGSGERQR
jgi:hypothetical protein